ncbi:leucine-rich repeat-containing protein 25 [Echinops telfairi]|uniref:Leucine-rich repeat-containing protein 25 n=1 Tax=Echinops telfairi TaxID=9371 RepID=A0ABM0IQP8_ECHTE|nr:leucine-rich repeat-containing protein 25 [Echinops telfairi]
MGVALLWVLLLLLLKLWAARTTEDACLVSLDPGNWTAQFTSKCLNFSNQKLTLPENQSLQASNVELLDLSSTGLRTLPPLFFQNLGSLRSLIVTGNRLDRISGALAARCDLELQADCGCGLAAWQKVRADNCSGQLALKCLDLATGTWRNLSAFLQVSCAPGLTPSTIGAVVAGVCLSLGLLIASPLLVWRLRRHQLASSHGLRQTQTGKDEPRHSSTRQPRYSSRSLHPKPPVVTPQRLSTPDYENMFVGQLAGGPSTQAYHWDKHGTHFSEDDFYMNYEGERQTSQPVYGNLGSLGQASLDEEEYVIPGR